MIKIPDEVVKAGARALHDACAHESMDVCRGFARAACLAMLEAWPGMTREGVVMARRTPRITLPLPQEASDD